MKIIISPAKTMQFDSVDLNGVSPKFTERTNSILKQLRELNDEELKNLYKVKGKLFDDVLSFIKGYETLDENIAIKAYTGMVFKGLELDEYNDDQWNYLIDNVYILSAFYGLLTPNTLIKKYRLDFNIMKSLYKMWDDLEQYLPEPIINLASKEFSKLISKPMVNIEFREYKNGKYVNVATYSKQARGLMLNYLIKNKINSIENIKEFNLDNYKFNDELSNDNDLFFTRKK